METLDAKTFARLCQYLMQKSCGTTSTCLSCLVSSHGFLSISYMKTTTARYLWKFVEIELSTNPGFPFGLCNDCELDSMMRPHHIESQCWKTIALLKSMQPIVVLERLIKTEPADDFSPESIELNNRSLSPSLFEEVDVKIKCGSDEDFIAFLNSASTESSKNNLKCKVCGMLCGSIKGLKIHFTKIHTKKGQFKCEKCDYTTNHKGKFKIHLSKHSLVKSYKCNICKKSFNSPSDLNQHRRVHHENQKRYTCNICKKWFSSNSLLEEHKSMPEVHPILKCDNCTYVTYCRQYLVHHMKSHSNEKLKKKASKIRVRPELKCDNCPYTSYYRHCLISHLKLHSNMKLEELKSGQQKKLFQCKVCAFVGSAQCLKRHMLTHTTDKPFYCDVCNTSWKSLLHLKRHKYVHTDNISTWFCKPCRKRFSSKFLLDEHNSIPDIHLFKCDKCSFFSNRKGVYILHMEEHLRGKPNVCNVCNKIFNTRRGLKSHELLHPNNRTFYCKMCRRLFQNKELFEEHNSTPNIHLFKCNICGFKTNIKTRMKYHNRLHAKAKPFNGDVSDHSVDKKKK